MRSTIFICKHGTTAQHCKVCKPAVFHDLERWRDHVSDHPHVGSRAASTANPAVLYAYDHDGKRIGGFNEDTNIGVFKPMAGWLV